MTEELCDIAANRGWEITGDSVAEGQAKRTPVTLADGTMGLHYAWQDATLARRAAWCHHPSNGAQLFAVPELIEDGDGWIVVQAIDGRPLSEFAGNACALGSDGTAILSAVGELLRKLHAITTSSIFGDVLESDDDEPTQWLTFNGYVASNFERYAERARSLGLSEAQQAEITRRIGHIRQELAAFHPRSRCTLVHGRMAFEHVWIGENGDVVGLTGFEHAAHLPPELDLAWLLWIAGCGGEERLVRALYRGYGAARTMDVQRRERFYRRMVAFAVLFGDRGEAGLGTDELLRLTAPVLD